MMGIIDEIQMKLKEIEEQEHVTIDRKSVV